MTLKHKSSILVLIGLLCIALLASPLSEKDDQLAWSNYLHTYMTNYQESYTYK